MNNIIVHYEVSRFCFTLTKIPANLHVFGCQIIFHTKAMNIRTSS